jgi:hypothetical protein
MTLKKYNVIICFIIILNLVVNVVIAQENTLEPPSQTISSKAPETTSSSENTENGENGENTAESCLKNIACTNANDTLRSCNGLLKTPDKYIEEGIRSGIYKTEGKLKSNL